MSEQQIDCMNDSKQQEDVITYFFRIENMENIDKITIKKQLAEEFKVNILYQLNFLCFWCLLLIFDIGLEKEINLMF